MLSNSMIVTVLPAVDLDRARDFYENKLGFRMLMKDNYKGLTFQAGQNTMFYIYQRSQTKATHTVAEFVVENLDAEVSNMKSKGIKFLEYDIPEMGIKTVNGIAQMGDSKGAWFNDTEGNIIALGEWSPTVKNTLKEKQMAFSR